MAKPSDINLIPLKPSVLSSLEDRADYVNIPGRTPEIGDKAMADTKEVGFSGYCDCFDLSDPSDRAEYAELSAKCFNGSEYIRLWEERVVADGNIKVFVNYIKYINVNQSYTRPLKIEDK